MSDMKFNEISNYLQLNYHSDDVLMDNQFIKDFSLLYYDKLITMNNDMDLLFSNFINYLGKKMLDSEGKLDIKPFVDMFSKAISKYDSKSIDYGNWICFIKSKCAYVASHLNLYLWHFYYDELCILEKIIIDDVTSILTNEEKYNDIAYIIFDYAKYWMYEPDDIFYLALNSIKKLGRNDLFKKLINIAEKNTDKIDSFAPGYKEKIGKKY